MDRTVLETVNPLQSLPSMLAIRDIRRRLLFSGLLVRRSECLTRLMALDPLSVLRALRLAGAPINGLRSVTSIGQLSSQMGVVFLERVLGVPTVEGENTAAIRELWLHSIATAHAARSLAEATDQIDPEQAYLLGLLHDLPLWLEHLGLHARGEPWDLDPIEFIRKWNLPEIPLVSERPSDLDLADPHALIKEQPDLLFAVAEQLAELADFAHPERDPSTEKDLVSAASKEALVLAHVLRHDVKKSLHEFELDPNSGEGADASTGAPSDLRLFGARSLGSLAQLVVTMLQCSRSSSYLGIVTVATSAALRYLDFERAYFICWNRKTQRCWIRAKADLSIRQMQRMRIEPTAAQIEALERAIETDSPQMLHREPEAKCLVGLTGADNAMVVSVNGEYSNPTFLMLDRNLSGRPIDLEEDGRNAQALGGTVAILTVNLELKLRQIRAERFAMTDPLTRLLNRGVGILALEQELSRVLREPKPLCVLMLDLDDFKVLNDKHGHLVGDSALRLVANVLRKTLRKADTVCRYGGEEFLVMLPDTTAEEASILAARLYVAIEQAGIAEDLPITVSIGLAAMRPDDAVTDTLIGRADRALYASKSRGRNRFSVDFE